MSRRGFTVIEVLVVIAIIGVLSTLAVIMISGVRGRAYDAKRLMDIRDLQMALDRYASDVGSYPRTITSGEPLLSPTDSTKTYLTKVPTNPASWGNCAGAGITEYSYRQASGGRSYSLSYCLSAGAAEFTAGLCQAMPGITCVHSTCDPLCQNIDKPCCGNCSAGDTCGGGVFFYSNFVINGNAYNLIASNSYTTREWQSAVSQTAVGANSTKDGWDNYTILSNTPNDIDNFPAVKYCDDLSDHDFIDWYLPAEAELSGLYSANQNNRLGFGSGLHWSSTEQDAAMAKTVDLGNGNSNGQTKNTAKGVRCIRRQ